MASTRRIGRATPGAIRILALCAIFLIPESAGAALGQPAGGELTLAYIDPGTGSFLVQALIAAVAGVAVTLRMYWSKIKGFFGGSTVASGGNDSANPSRDED